MKSDEKTISFRVDGEVLKRLEEWRAQDGGCSYKHAVLSRLMPDLHGTFEAPADRTPAWSRMGIRDLAPGEVKVVVIRREDVAKLSTYLLGLQARTGIKLMHTCAGAESHDWIRFEITRSF